MSRICRFNILFSRSYTYLILFLSISTYIHNCIIARTHCRCRDVTKREFRWHKRRSFPITLMLLLLSAVNETRFRSNHPTHCYVIWLSSRTITRPCDKKITHWFKQDRELTVLTYSTYLLTHPKFNQCFGAVLHIDRMPKSIPFNCVLIDSEADP